MHAIQNNTAADHDRVKIDADVDGHEMVHAELRI